MRKGHLNVLDLRKMATTAMEEVAENRKKEGSHGYSSLQITYDLSD